MRERILDILNGLNELVDYEGSTSLIDDGVIDSIDLMGIISELEEEFEVEIDMEYIIPDNFNSVDAMVNMIEKLMA